MNAIKERIIGAVTIMNDRDAEKVWHLIQHELSEPQINWDDIEETEPTEDEVNILKAYRNGDAGYQQSLTQDELIMKLGLDS